MRIIVAASNNNVIGKDNGLPWNVPEDLRHFAKTTKSGSLIMGYNTYKSLPGPLKGRSNYVIDNNLHLDYYFSHQYDNLMYVQSLSYLVYNRRGLLLNPNTYLIGGAKTFEEALNSQAEQYITEIILTRINLTVEGDRHFAIPPGWVCLVRQKLSDMATVEYYRRGN